MTLQEFFTAASEISARFFRRRGLFISALCRYQAPARRYARTLSRPRSSLHSSWRTQSGCARSLARSFRSSSSTRWQIRTWRKTPPTAATTAKRGCLAHLQQRALADGYTVLLDGTNASDDAGDRPGMQALSELHVISPLRLCGLTKPQIRELSREAGLFTWDKPAYACLATRIPTGRGHHRTSFSRAWRARSRRCSRSALRIFACGCSMTRRACSSSPHRCSRRLRRRSEILENMKTLF